MANIKIALRVRPLSEKEKLHDYSSKTVVNVKNDKTVAVTNLKVPTSNAGDSRERVKYFNFDNCFDSSHHSEDNHACQELIYEKLGTIVLDSLSKGKDACVLAYGQSSSGKTYTMEGTDGEPGLAPRLCRSLMDNSENSKAVVSFFEIYNERVRDLLAINSDNSVKNCQKKDLRVREHPKRGPYVEDLSEVSVNNAEELYSVWFEGVKRRRTAPTATNLRSSRSHALLSIRRHLPYPPVTLTLLDLAGSERPSKTNQSLPRQKEGANINKSLVALANVISALVGSGSGRARYVPYRDSVLTWLLKDTLGDGNTTTIMIATVSPSAGCYSETVNTMRWASRAGKIPAISTRQATVSEGSPYECTIRKLRAEVARLRALLDSELSQNRAETGTMRPPKSESRKESVAADELSDIGEAFKEEIGGENELAESGDSLGSSRVSVASEETLSGNQSVPSNNSEDNFFGPRLERVGSAHDVKLNKRLGLGDKNRQYSSHEVLAFLDAPIKPKQLQPKTQVNSETINESMEDKAARKDDDQSRQEDKTQKEDKTIKKSDAPSPLYAKLKKREEEKPKNVTTGDRKINNKMLTPDGRKKLFDLSHRALWATRRYRVGIPVETQTSKPSVTRMKNVETDVPGDLEPYEKVQLEENVTVRSVGIATEQHTRLCKEASVGTPGGSIIRKDKSVETDKVSDINALVITRSCGHMTDNLIETKSIETQTDEVKKKCSSFTKYLKLSHESDPGVLMLSITHDCGQLDIGGLSDDSLEDDEPKTNSQQVITAPPDLLHNHNSSENVTDGSETPATEEKAAEEKQQHAEEAPPVRPKREKQSLTNKFFALKKKQAAEKAIEEAKQASSTSVNSNVTQNIFYNNTYRNQSVGCESKSIQVPTADEALANYVDFLDDLYVPLPRIYFNPDYTTDHWPTMKNLILGRNENMYPFNIKMSPKKENNKSKRSSKSVSWKNEDRDTKSSPRKHSKKSILKPFFLNQMNSQVSASESEAVDSDDVLSESSDVKVKHRSPPGPKYFKGIHCWADRSPTAPLRKKHKEQMETENCFQYVRATSNLLNEATNLVTVLSKVSNKINEPSIQQSNQNDTAENNVPSPNCNSPLQIQDENISDEKKDNQNEAQQKDCAGELSSHEINEQLLNNDEQSSNEFVKNNEQVLDNKNEDEKIVSEVKISIEEAENNLLASLNRLEVCTKSTSDYFENMSDKYKQKFNRDLPRYKSSNNYFHSRRSPRKYLQELLEMRKELVDYTKRDDDDSKQS